MLRVMSGVGFMTDRVQQPRDVVVRSRRERDHGRGGRRRYRANASHSIAGSNAICTRSSGGSRNADALATDRQGRVERTIQAIRGDDEPASKHAVAVFNRAGASQFVVQGGARRRDAPLVHTRQRHAERKSHFFFKSERSRPTGAGRQAARLAAARAGRRRAALR